MDSLLKCGANYVPLSPITFLPRAASVYADRTSIIYQNTRFTWNQTYHRCLRLSSALRSLLYIKKNDVVCLLKLIIMLFYVFRAILFYIYILNIYIYIGISPGTEYSGDIRDALRRANGRSGAEHDKHKTAC